MSVFTYIPDYGAAKEVKPVVSKIRFGDGYAQRATFGINTQPQIWSLQFVNRTKEEADEIEAFLIDKAGVEPFDWTPIGSETALKFTCESWSRVIVRGNFYSITAKFEQCFDP